MKKILFFAAAAMILTACDKNEDNPDPTSGAAIITASIGESPVTRATGNSWAPNDTIGISSTVGETEGPYINIKYTTLGGDGIFTGKPIFYYNPMVLTAYYPFNGETGTPPGPNADGIIVANTRTDNQKPENQPKIDFLWDSQTGFTAQKPNVDFKFTHKMSKITFVFQSSEEVKDSTGLVIAGPVNVEDMYNYKLNLVLDGKFDTKTGVCAVNTDASPEVLSIDVNDVKHDMAVPSLIIFPQTLTEHSTTLDIYTDEIKQTDESGNRKDPQHYKCNLGFSNGEIKPGYHYQYTIKVSKLGLIVGKMTVEPWKLENRYMTATIDGENPFQQQN